MHCGDTWLNGMTAKIQTLLCLSFGRAVRSIHLASGILSKTLPRELTLRMHILTDFAIPGQSPICDLVETSSRCNPFLGTAAWRWYATMPGLPKWMLNRLIGRPVLRITGVCFKC